MNLKEIRKKYPKSITKLKEFKHPIPGTKYGLYNFSLYFQSERLLYDFFDAQEIYIQISVKCAMDDSIWYLAYIWSGKFDEHLQDEKTRIKSEKAAFEKAFEILEQKLK